MRSTGEAGVRGAHVLDAVSHSPKLAVKIAWRIEQRPIDPVHIFTFLYPGPEPNCLTPGPFPSTINLTSGRRFETARQHPAYGGQGLRRTKPFFQSAFQAIDYLGSSTRIRQN